MALNAPIGSAIPSQPPQVWLLVFKVSCDTVQLWKLGSGCWEEWCEASSGPPPIRLGAVLKLRLWPKLCCGMPVLSQTSCWLGFVLHLPHHYGLAWRLATTGAWLTAVLALDLLCSSSLGNMGLCPLQVRRGCGPCLPCCPLWLLAHLSMQSSLFLLLPDKYSPVLRSHLTYNILITYVSIIL